MAGSPSISISTGVQGEPELEDGNIAPERDDQVQVVVSDPIRFEESEDKRIEETFPRYTESSQIQQVYWYFQYSLWIARVDGRWIDGSHYGAANPPDKISYKEEIKALCNVLHGTQLYTQIPDVDKPFVKDVLPLNIEGSTVYFVTMAKQFQNSDVIYKIDPLRANKTSNIIDFEFMPMYQAAGCVYQGKLLFVMEDTLVTFTPVVIQKTNSTPKRYSFTVSVCQIEGDTKFRGKLSRMQQDKYEEKFYFADDANAITFYPPNGKRKPRLQSSLHFITNSREEITFPNP